MPNWTESLEETFEYYIVDPGTWKDVRKLDNIKSSTITRDLSAETLGSASMDISESIGECYIRIYLITIQNGIKEYFPLGTYLVQTPSIKFDGKTQTVSLEAYTPLLELKENPPPLGYYVEKGANVMDSAYRLVREHTRAPVIDTECPDTVYKDFITNARDTWLSYISDLIETAKYSFDLDEMGRILFAPKQDTASLQPVWTYTDDNSSILYPELSVDHDLYGIPNVVEVLYSSGKDFYYSKVVNDDPNSPTSTIARGREIIHRITDPKVVGIATQDQIDEYAKQTLRNLSTLEYSVSYSHGYCPVRVGDCIRLDYKQAGIKNVKARVIRQTIRCESGCRVDEKAVFTIKLWR